MSSTQDSNLQQPSYELYEPRMETQDTADAHVLLVHLPDFARQQVGAYYEAAYKRIRVFGEKPIENNKRIRFSKVYTIPEDCDADKLKGRFQEGAITLTIPKKPKEPKRLKNKKQPNSHCYSSSKYLTKLNQKQQI
ncbi:hypothetical protein K1719_024571 [Acacia pycnantha]|nr:hypothetical protein K1719_024571 [Acacia pycnantha]